MIEGRIDILVIGGGVAGLVAARRAALAGATVALLEAEDRAGGMLRRAGLGELGIDIGAEAFATRGGAVEALLVDLGLAAELVEPRALGSWGFAGGEPYPMPKGSVLGIPADPASDDVRRALGDEGAARAARDAELGPELGLCEETLDGLVRIRMGDAAADRLATAVGRGVYSVDARELDPHVLMPGLERRLREHGALGAAVAAMRASSPPGAIVHGVRGGMHRVIAALLAELAQLGVPVRTGSRVVELAPGDGEWTATLESGRSIRAGSVVATVPVPGLQIPTASAAGGDVAVEVVALLVGAPELDAHPRGTGILVGDPMGEVRAKALTHVTAKWEWLDALTGPGRHVLRLSYPPAEGEAVPITAELDVPQLLERACADASMLLGVELGPGQVLDHARQTWWMPSPPARLGRAAELAAIRAEAESAPGLALAGTWIDGTGLASVVPGADRAVARLLG